MGHTDCIPLFSTMSYRTYIFIQGLASIESSRYGFLFRVPLCRGVGCSCSSISFAIRGDDDLVLGRARKFLGMKCSEESGYVPDLNRRRLDKATYPLARNKVGELKFCWSRGCFSTWPSLGEMVVKVHTLIPHCISLRENSTGRRFRVRFKQVVINLVSTLPKFTQGIRLSFTYVPLVSFNSRRNLRYRDM